MTIQKLYLMNIINDYTEITVYNPSGNSIAYGRWNLGEVYTFAYDDIINFTLTNDNHAIVTLKEQFYTLKYLVNNGLITKETNVTVLRKDGTILGQGRMRSSYIAPYWYYKISELFFKRQHINNRSCGKGPGIIQVIW